MGMNIPPTDSFFGSTDKTAGTKHTEPQSEAGVTDTRYQTRVPRSSAGAGDIGQNDIGNTKTTEQSGRGNVIGGDASARTAMGGGSGGGGGGSGGGGGGGGGYSLGASIAGTQTSSAGFSGEINAARGQTMFGGSFDGGLVVNKGGTQTTGVTGTNLAVMAGLGLAALVGVFLVLRRA